MREIDAFYLNQEEPVKSCLLYLRQFILDQDNGITEAWKYKMPFFCYKGKMFCYLWLHKKSQQPYLGVVDGKLINHPLLITENRSKMKIIMFDAGLDLPVATIGDILQKAIAIRNKSQLFNV